MHDILIAHPKTDEQVSALKAFMLALHIDFEVAEEHTYNPDFVKKINESRAQVKNGKAKRVEKDNLKSFLGI